VPDLLDRSEVDEVIAVSTADAFEMARRATRVEGLFSGPSTGANIVASLQLAERLGPGRTVVTVQVDSGLKYLAGELYHANTGDEGAPTR
jgi:cysteine synthase A